MIAGTRQRRRLSATLSYDAPHARRRDCCPKATQMIMVTIVRCTCIYSGQSFFLPPQSFRLPLCWSFYDTLYLRSRYSFVHQPFMSVNWPMGIGDFGVFHASEIPFVFYDTFELRGGELSLSAAMATYWTNLAGSGDPNIHPKGNGMFDTLPSAKTSGGYTKQSVSCLWFAYLL